MDSTERLSPDQLQRAAELLKEGRLVAFPTETVYGLGAPIFLPQAIQSIFKVKGRPADNPLIAHVSSVEQVSRIALEIPDAFYRLAEVFFPGPLTVVLKRRPDVPSIVSAGLETIAVRMPSHPIALKLISMVDEPLVAPSANLSGMPSSTQAEHVLDDFDGKIAAVVDGGKTEIGIESTVINLFGETPILLRPGSISKEALEKVLGCPVLEALTKQEGPALSPGMKYRHYCPRTPIKLFHSFEDVRCYLVASPQHKRRMFLSRQPLQPQMQNVDHFSLSSQEFYSYLRQADQQGYAEIIILYDADVQKESGLMNRLLRAAGVGCN